MLGGAVSRLGQGLCWAQGDLGGQERTKKGTWESDQKCLPYCPVSPGTRWQNAPLAPHPIEIPILQQEKIGSRLSVTGHGTHPQLAYTFVLLCFCISSAHLERYARAYELLKNRKRILSGHYAKKKRERKGFLRSSRLHSIVLSTWGLGVRKPRV